MNAQEILQNSKTLTLNYLQKIGANIEELHGLYTISIPTKYEGVFGGITKRITFDLEVASMHGCELVVPGSNFLAIILNEIRKQAPVVGGHFLEDQHHQEVFFLGKSGILERPVCIGKSVHLVP